MDCTEAIEYECTQIVAGAGPAADEQVARRAARGDTVW